MLALLQTRQGEDPLSADDVAGVLAAKLDVAARRVKRFKNVDDLLTDLHDKAGR